MDVFPAFRRRDVNTRGRYTLLDNESDTTSQHSISSSTRSSHNRHHHGDRLLLCDRCWTKHERKQASKRCMECRQNLCLICARRDEVRRPWWLPAVLVQCWRFFFSKALIPHSFVDLEPELEAGDRRSWVHTQEASHMQPIPRVTHDSLRSNRSNSKVNAHRYAYDNHCFVTRQSEQDPLVNKKHLPTDNMTRSRSFEGFKAQRRIRQRRYRSVEAMNGKPWVKDRPNDTKYESNWDNNDILSFRNDPSRRRVVKGKDIDIELGTEDVILTVIGDNVAEGNDQKYIPNSTQLDGGLNKPKCAIKKAKHKKGKQIANPEPYTEQIFSDHPIWFKRESSLPKKEGVYDKKKSVAPKKRNDALNEHLRQQHRRLDARAGGMSSMNSKYDMSGSESSVNKQSKLHTHHQNDKHKEESSRFEKFTVRDSFPSRRQNNGVSGNGHTRTASDNTPTSTAYIVEEPPDPCPICLEDLPRHESRLLHCSHEIHTRCLQELLSSMDIDFGIRCPVCNQMTPVKNYYAPPHLWYRELSVSTSI